MKVSLVCSRTCPESEFHATGPAQTQLTFKAKQKVHYKHSQSANILQGRSFSMHSRSTVYSVHQ